jgi:hypothetical protein
MPGECLTSTTGADGNVSFVELPGGVKVGLSGIGVYYPDERPTQRTGIAIDIPARSPR